MYALILLTSLDRHLFTVQFTWTWTCHSRDYIPWKSNMFPVQTLYFERPTQTPRRPPVFRGRCRPRWALPASTSPTFRVHTDHNTSPTATLKHTLE